MHYRAQQLFYGLSIFVFMTALFVLQDNHVTRNMEPVTAFKQEIKNQFAVAAVQTFGDQPVFDNVALVYDGVANFYKQASLAAIAMSADKQSDQDLAFIFKKTYSTFVAVLEKSSAKIAGVQIDATTKIDPSTFMTEDPIFLGNPKVLGVVTETPVNLQQPWVTIRDNLTGQMYCLAVYNGEVNKYLGVCKRDYH